MKVRKYYSLVITAAAKRDVARRRLELAQRMDIGSYPERARDMELLSGDCPRLRMFDQDALRAA